MRPTNSLVIVGTALYLAVWNRKDLLQFMATIAGWLALLLAYSWLHFHTLVPDYFAASRLQFVSPQVALLGSLVSPSRGLFVYVPAFIAIGLSMVRYRSTIRFRALAGLAAFVISGHVLTLSGFVHWWGGHSYGARLTTSLVPWFVLLAVLAVDAARGAGRLRASGRADIILGIVVALLCVASISINGIGAFSEESNQWERNTRRHRSFSGASLELETSAVSGGLRGAHRGVSSAPGDGIHLGIPEADKYLGLAGPTERARYAGLRGAARPLCDSRYR